MKESWKVLAAATVLAIVPLVVAGAASGEPGDCAGSLQAKINRAPAGSVVKAAACVYRENVQIDKPLTLDGGGESYIYGSIEGRQGGHNVTIRGIHVLYGPYSGVTNNGQPNWSLIDSEVGWAGVVNVRFTAAKGLLVRNTHIHHGGWAGLWGTNSEGLRVEGGEVAYNNPRGLSLDRTNGSSGGVIAKSASNVTFSGIHSHHNGGNGLWFDAPEPGQTSMVMSNNRSNHNMRHGLKCEVTLYCSIHDNVVYENGWRQGGAGITANGSSFLRVYDNVVAWNRDGIAIDNPSRTDLHRDEDYYDKVRDIEVDNNEVFQEEGRGQLALAFYKSHPGGNIFDPSADVRGHDNRYYFPNEQGDGYRFAWNGQLKLLRTFNGSPGEERGRYMTAQEKNGVLTANSVPLSP